MPQILDGLGNYDRLHDASQGRISRLLVVFPKIGRLSCSRRLMRLFVRLEPCRILQAPAQQSRFF